MKPPSLLVGTTRFELATSRTPSENSTFSLHGREWYYAIAACVYPHLWNTIKRDSTDNPQPNCKSVQTTANILATYMEGEDE